MNPRPKIQPPRKFLDRLFEAIALATVFYGIVLVLQSWSSLPATIPTHFNAKGEADGWGSKGMIWLLPSITIIMVPMMLLLRKFPWLSNTPIKINVENAELQYGLIVRLLSLLACAVSILFTVLVFDTISIARGGTSLLGWMFLPIILFATIAPIIWYFIAAFRGR